MPKLTVKSHRPVQWSVAIIALSTLIALLTWLMLDESHWSTIYSRMDVNQDFKRLSEVNRGLEKENKRLNEVVLMMQREAEVDKKTASLLQQNVQSMQDEIYRLKGELEFYQGVMDATRESTGLSIQGIHIESLPQENSFRLKVVLTHVAKGIRIAEGNMTVTIEGLKNGEPSNLNLQDITLDQGLDLSFKFRNFKRFESDLELPPEFVPRRVLVQLQPKGVKQANIKRVFDWPDSTS